MGRIADPTTRRWTYDDYARLTTEGEYFEIIEREAFVNPPATSWHQRASKNLEYLIESFLRGRDLGEMLHAPLDVVFSDVTVLQPDIVVVLKENDGRTRKEGIFGAPDLVVEL